MQLLLVLRNTSTAPPTRRLSTRAVKRRALGGQGPYEVGPQLLVLGLEEAVKVPDPREDARGAVVERLDKVVADLGHQVDKAEEGVGLGVLVPPGPALRDHDVVERRHNVVHALHVADPGVQLGVQEQDAQQHLPVQLLRQRSLDLPRADADADVDAD